MIDIKTEKQIQTMRIAGKKLAKIFQILKENTEIGTDTWSLEVLFLELCKKESVLPPVKGYAPYSYPPFPTGLCLSINHESVHNSPKKGKKVKEGDIVNIDTDIKYEDMYVDAAISFYVGETSDSRKKLLKTCKQALDQAINIVREGTRVGEISHMIQDTAEKAGYNVLRDYAGHGIGKEMHEDPQIPCYGNPKAGPILKAGMTICIEPLITAGSQRLKHIGFWETQTLDKSDFVQMEHTVLVKKDGFEILTTL